MAHFPLRNAGNFFAANLLIAIAHHFFTAIKQLLFCYIIFMHGRSSLRLYPHFIKTPTSRPISANESRRRRRGGEDLDFKHHILLAKNEEGEGGLRRPKGGTDILASIF